MKQNIREMNGVLTIIYEIEWEEVENELHEDTKDYQCNRGERQATDENGVLKKDKG